MAGDFPVLTPLRTGLLTRLASRCILLFRITWCWVTVWRLVSYTTGHCCSTAYVHTVPPLPRLLRLTTTWWWWWWWCGGGRCVLLLVKQPPQCVYFEVVGTVVAIAYAATATSNFEVWCYCSSHPIMAAVGRQHHHDTSKFEVVSSSILRSQ